MLSKPYPFKKPSSPWLKSWDGTLENLVLGVGLGINQNSINDCLLCPDGVLVWSKHTLAELDGNGGELRAK